MLVSRHPFPATRRDSFGETLPRELQSVYGPAMTESQASEALNVGADIAREAIASGARLLVPETWHRQYHAVSCLDRRFTRSKASEVTGRGTGIDDDMLVVKTRVIETALARVSFDAHRSRFLPRWEGSRSRRSQVLSSRVRLRGYPSLSMGSLPSRRPSSPPAFSAARSGILDCRTPVQRARGECRTGPPRSDADSRPGAAVG